MITNLLMLALLVGIVLIYFSNNPLKHDSRYRWRCFLNWFPLGMTYAFLYMARYNLTVSKNALGDLMTKEDFGIIFGAGTLTYAFSFLINGPLIDKIGGKKGMLIGAIGTVTANILMGVILYLYLNKSITLNLTIVFSILYSFNMYFQSYGAVSIVKVNAYWFHVKERGIFGGIFGTLIAMGIYFAFDWGEMVVKATQIVPAAEAAAQGIINPTWYVFFVPAAILVFWIILDIFLIRDMPSQAGFKDFDTGDASSGEMQQNFTVWELYRKIFTHPVIMTVAFIELCTGVIRNGIMHWYLIFGKELNYTGAEAFFIDNWGLLLCLAGVSGGFIAGFISDKLFHSRRGPSAAFLYGTIIFSVSVMIFVLFDYPMILGAMVLLISLCVIGAHGMLSGTATMDFGGRKGAATAVGVIDGFVYLGTGLQSLSLGFITSWNWQYWPVFLLPFALIGFALSLKIWKAMPNAKKGGGH